MSDDIKKRHKRLRLTQKEIQMVILVVDSHFEGLEEDEHFRQGESVVKKLRAELHRLIAKENEASRA